MVRRACFELAGVFCEDLHSCEDYEMWCRILCETEYRAELVPLPLTFYRLRGSQPVVQFPQIPRQRRPRHGASAGPHAVSAGARAAGGACRTLPHCRVEGGIDRADTDGAASARPGRAAAARPAAGGLARWGHVGGRAVAGLGAGLVEGGRHESKARALPWTRQVAAAPWTPKLQSSWTALFNTAHPWRGAPPAALWGGRGN